MDVRQKVEKVSIAGQQMIEIAKALSVEPKILIMDEPTAALNDQETEKLFQVLDRLRQNGDPSFTLHTVFQRYTD